MGKDLFDMLPPGEHQSYAGGCRIRQLPRARPSLRGEHRVVELLIYGNKGVGLEEMLPPAKLAFAVDGSGGSAGKYFKFDGAGKLALLDSID